ncbi:hypothetical protein BY996DRAFT_6409686 [Phakopsora pachyrhizi]|nr:hypothetical protein BY996DRAFT_6409686 [Phakopsora pachyrhizi]
MFDVRPEFEYWKVKAKGRFEIWASCCGICSCPNAGQVLMWLKITTELYIVVKTFWLLYTEASEVQATKRNYELIKVELDWCDGDFSCGWMVVGGIYMRQKL